MSLLYILEADCRIAVAHITIHISSLVLAYLIRPPWSKWKDLNSRPQRPKRRALPNYATLRQNLSPIGY